jgi:hypothetical protein
MLSINLSITSLPICSQHSYKAFLNSAIDLRRDFATYRSNSSHKCSIMLKSWLWGDHSSRSTLFSVNHLFAKRDVYFGSLSDWKINMSLIPIHSALAIKFLLMMSTYSFAFIFVLISAKLLTPEAETHP